MPVPGDARRLQQVTAVVIAPAGMVMYEESNEGSGPPYRSPSSEMTWRLLDYREPLADSR